MSDPERDRMITMRAAHIVAAHANVPVSLVLRPIGRDARRLRQEAAYLAVVAAGITKCGAARQLGLQRYSVQKALAWVEERRDDPSVDRRLTRLERRMEMVA